MAAARMTWWQKWPRKQGRSKKASRPASISAAKSVTETFHWICFVMMVPSLVWVVTVATANPLPRNAIKRDLDDLIDGDRLRCLTLKSLAVSGGLFIFASAGPL